jgi:hypothetical protein
MCPFAELVSNPTPPGQISRGGRRWLLVVYSRIDMSPGLTGFLNVLKTD